MANLAGSSGARVAPQRCLVLGQVAGLSHPLLTQCGLSWKVHDLQWGPFSTAEQTLKELTGRGWLFFVGPHLGSKSFLKEASGHHRIWHTWCLDETGRSQLDYLWAPSDLTRVRTSFTTCVSHGSPDVLMSKVKAPNGTGWRP